ncbi:MAG: hypothetical protein WCR51_05225 [Planctomycetia bacterium]
MISAIPGSKPLPATPAMVVETIEAGTRGPAPIHGRVERCHADRCSHGRCGHAGCRQGKCDVPGCPAHCPVRPASFGFYDTQWRTWPGQEVVQATHAEPAAPVMPPRSEVPRVEEESPVPGFEPPAPEPEGSQAEPSESETPEPSTPEAVVPAPLPQRAAPDTLPPPEDRPQPEKPAAPAEENLFDEAALRRRSQERIVMLRQAAVQQERLRHEALRQQAQRLSRPPVGGGEAPAATPSVATTLPAGRLVSETPRPALETPLQAAEDEGRALKQAVHAEPAPRGLRDATLKLLQGNPLR